MFTADAYLPTRIILGAGRLDELKTAKMPGKKALVCTSGGSHMRKVLERVGALLRENGTAYEVYTGVAPNPTLRMVREATGLAKAAACDFVLGLGGGSSIDTAKAVAVMMVNEGDLWDYACAGSGGRKVIERAAPIVTVTTTSGTGTESDPFSVITNEATQEKLDFAVEALFPVLSIIDPELMCALPRDLAVFQGFTPCSTAPSATRQTAARIGLWTCTRPRGCAPWPGGCRWRRKSRTTSRRAHKWPSPRTSSAGTPWPLSASPPTTS